MDLNVHIEVFDGPFDLLYKLIEKNEIDIYDIPIAELADQYILHVNALRSADMESMSSFIVLAATLLEIKSKMLLPGTPSETEEDPREQLVQKLIEYKKFKQIAEMLNETRENVGSLYFGEGDLEQFADYKETRNYVEELLTPVTLEALRRALAELLLRKERNVDRVRAGFGSLYKDKYTVEEKTDYIRTILKKAPTVEFNELFDDCAEKSEIVVTFLALLELIKSKEIVVTQNKLFGSIKLSLRSEVTAVDGE